MVSNMQIPIHKSTNAIKSQVNEKPRDFLVVLKRKRSLFKEGFSAENLDVDVLNLNFLVFLGINWLVF